MRTKSFYNQLKQRPKTDLERISNKNPLKRLIKPVHKFSILVTEIYNKVQEPKTYDKTINNSVYEKQITKSHRQKVLELSLSLDLELYCFTFKLKSN